MTESDVTITAAWIYEPDRTTYRACVDVPGRGLLSGFANHEGLIEQGSKIDLCIRDMMTKAILDRAKADMGADQ